jgi:hypothetical protein
VQYRLSVPTEELAKVARRSVHETTILQAQGKIVGIADVVLMKNGPDVVGTVELSHATFGKMHQIAALAMSGNSALVAINTLMLNRTKPAGIARRSGDQTSLLRPADSVT